MDTNNHGMTPMRIVEKGVSLCTKIILKNMARKFRLTTMSSVSVRPLQLQEPGDRTTFGVALQDAVARSPVSVDDESVLDEAKLRGIYNQFERNSHGELTRVEIIASMRRHENLRQQLFEVLGIGRGDYSDESFEGVYQHLDMKDDGDVSVDVFFEYVRRARRTYLNRSGESASAGYEVSADTHSNMSMPFGTTVDGGSDNLVYAREDESLGPTEATSASAKPIEHAPPPWEQALPHPPALSSQAPLPQYDTVDEADPPLGATTSGTAAGGSDDSEESDESGDENEATAPKPNLKFVPPTGRPNNAPPPWVKASSAPPKEVTSTESAGLDETSRRSGHMAAIRSTIKDCAERVVQEAFGLISRGENEISEDDFVDVLVGMPELRSHLGITTQDLDIPRSAGGSQYSVAVSLRKMFRQMSQADGDAPDGLKVSLGGIQFQDFFSPKAMSNGIGSASSGGRPSLPNTPSIMPPRPPAVSQNSSANSGDVVSLSMPPKPRSIPEHIAVGHEVSVSSTLVSSKYIGVREGQQVDDSSTTVFHETLHRAAQMAMSPRNDLDTPPANENSGKLGNLIDNMPRGKGVPDAVAATGNDLMTASMRNGSPTKAQLSASWFRNGKPRPKHALRVNRSNASKVGAGGAFSQPTLANGGATLEETKLCASSDQYDPAVTPSYMRRTSSITTKYGTTPVKTQRGKYALQRQSIGANDSLSWCNDNFCCLLVPCAEKDDEAWEVEIRQKHDERSSNLERRWRRTIGAKSPTADERQNLMNFSMKPARARSLPPPKQSQRQIIPGQANRKFSLKETSAPRAPSPSRPGTSSSRDSTVQGTTAMRGPSVKKRAPPPAPIHDRKPWGAVRSTIRPTKPRSPVPRERSKSTPPLRADQASAISSVQTSVSRLEERRSVRFGKHAESDGAVPPLKPSVPKFAVSQTLRDRHNSFKAEKGFDLTASAAVKKSFASKKLRSATAAAPAAPGAQSKDLPDGKQLSVDTGAPSSTSGGRRARAKANIYSALRNDPRSRSLPPPGTPSPTKRRAARKAPMPAQQ